MRRCGRRRNDGGEASARRPSKYRPEYAEQAFRLCLLGEELEASGWHMGTAVRALAARLRLTHRNAERAVGEVLDAVAIRH